MVRVKSYWLLKLSHKGDILWRWCSFLELGHHTRLEKTHRGIPATGPAEVPANGQPQTSSSLCSHPRLPQARRAQPKAYIKCSEEVSARCPKRAPHNASLWQDSIEPLQAQSCTNSPKWWEVRGGGMFKSMIFTRNDLDLCMRKPSYTAGHIPGSRAAGLCHASSLLSLPPQGPTPLLGAGIPYPAFSLRPGSSSVHGVLLLCNIRFTPSYLPVNLDCSTGSRRT